MSRTRKKGKRHHRSARTPLSARGDPAALEAKARSKLNYGHYRDAIAAYKALLKGEQRSHWLDELAQAYRGRAAELANKGLFKEAVAIWEQRAAACDKPLAAASYLIWLIHANQDEQAIRLFCAESEKLKASGGLATLREYFAAYVLAGHTQIVELLPPEDPVVRDHGATQNAMYAYCEGNDGACDASLKAIPFRSPYRNFCQILKALRLQALDPGDANGDAIGLLERVDAHSPFRGMADSIMAMAQAQDNPPQVLAQLDPDTLGFAAALKGWSEVQLGLLQAAAKLGDSPHARALLSFIIRYRHAISHAIGEEYARDAAANLLIHFPDGQRSFAKSFGRLSPFSQARLEALAAEQEGDPYEADEAWRLALEELYDQDMDERDNRLRAALILRRLADLWARRPGDGILDQSVVEDLVESLQLDPDDRSTHLRLIAAHRHARQLKQARLYLKAALERFPDDTEVLLEAVETASAGNAFKKAAGYAKQLLSLDPINVKVQNVLLKAHIGHARKQIEAGKYPLARRELDEAATWARAAAAEGKVSILRGLVELAAGELELGRQLLQQGAERLGGGLAGHFHLLLEGARLGRAPGTLLKRAQLPKPSGFATREHVLALIHAINAIAEDDKPWLEESLAPLIEPVRRAASQTFSQTEMELICETLHRQQQLNLLDIYAKQAAKRWPDRPAFLYHRLYAKGDGSCHGLSNADIDRLDDALVQAREEGDMRTVHRISELLEPPFHFPSPGDWPPPVDFQRGFADAVDELGVDGVAEILEAVADPKEFEAFRELLNENQLRQLIEVIASGGDPEAFLRSIVEGLGFSGKPKSKKKAKRKPATDDPDQLDLFE